GEKVTNNMDADHGFPSRVKSDRRGMLLSDRHGCYYVIGMNVIERSPCVGICSRQSWRRQLERGSVLCTKRYRGRCQLLLKDDEMLWRFMENDEIALTNNEAERALRGYVLWRKGSYGVWSHRGEQFRQRILSLVETAKRLGRCPQEWLRAVVRSCIEKTDYPFPEELVLSTPSR
ncbi:TPA: transposase, partial [Aeromonas hydrophila]